MHVAAFKDHHECAQILVSIIHWYDSYSHLIYARTVPSPKIYSSCTPEPRTCVPGYSKEVSNCLHMLTYFVRNSFGTPIYR